MKTLGLLFQILYIMKINYFKPADQISWSDRQIYRIYGQERIKTNSITYLISKLMNFEVP